MKDIMTKGPILPFTIVSVLATVISVRVLKSRSGPLAIFPDQMDFRVLISAIVLSAGATLSYLAMRLATGPQVRSVDQALDELEKMTGLSPVIDEVNKLLASLEEEAKRRGEGLPVTPVSRCMVFTGPPGVGKTAVARAIGDIYRSFGVLRKGHVIETDRAGLVTGYVGQTTSKTLDRCNEALDGVLFIDEAYSLAPEDGGSSDFGKEAIDTLLKFMEDNRDRIVVIVAGHSNEMRWFMTRNTGLETRFTKTIEFPAYSNVVEIRQWRARRIKSQNWSSRVNHRGAAAKRSAQRGRLRAITPASSKLLSYHRSFWMSGPWYRRVWYVGPSALAASVLAFIMLPKPAAPIGAPWTKPTGDSSPPRQEDSGCRINPFFAPRDPARVFGKVQGIASPEEVRRITDLVELKSNAAISPDYRGLPRIFASFTWGGVPTDTIAAIIDGHIPKIGETVQLEMRHRDPRFPCSFIPVIVRPH